MPVTSLSLKMVTASKKNTENLRAGHDHASADRLQNRPYAVGPFRIKSGRLGLISAPRRLQDAAMTNFHGYLFYYLDFSHPVTIIISVANSAALLPALLSTST